MSSDQHFWPNLHRGSLLVDQKRSREALGFIQAAIAANPDSPQGYAELARCWNDIPEERRRAIPAIDRAIALAPENSFYRGAKSWYLICQARHQAALGAAQEGLALDPTCLKSLNALANAHTKLNRWKKAEAACRRILALNPHDAPGLNLLAQALRHLGRWKESREVVARLLAHMPNNSFGHANAGFAALAAGDHLRANEHFRESLRMDPHFDLARRGLLESLRARVWTVRMNQRIISFLQTPWARIPISPILLYAVLSLVLVLGWILLVNPLLPDAGLDALTVFLGIFFGYVALSLLVRTLGNLLLMIDPLGRHALTTSEKRRAWFSAIWLGLICVVNPFFGGLVLLGIVPALALVQYPLLKDRYQRHRAGQADSA